jgi:hypothetical protein
MCDECVNRFRIYCKTIWKANLVTPAGKSGTINLSGFRKSFPLFEEGKLTPPISFYPKPNICNSLESSSTDTTMSGRKESTVLTSKMRLPAVAGTVEEARYQAGTARRSHIVATDIRTALDRTI